MSTKKVLRPFSSLCSLQQSNAAVLTSFRFLSSSTRVFTTPPTEVLQAMFKRSILALLFMLVAVLSCAQADNAVPNTLEEVPPGVTLVGGQEPIPSATTEQFIGGGRRFFRNRFMFPYGGGFRYGWRYPIGYWNTFGRGIYGPRCMFGRPFGGFFYC